MKKILGIGIVIVSLCVSSCAPAATPVPTPIPMPTVPHSCQWERSYNGQEHWDVCLICERIEAREGHVYDNACDTECNVCHYGRSASHSFEATLRYDETQHWRECSRCGFKTGMGEHVYADGDTCSACAYVRAEGN